jgi:hypothetical protein
MSHENEKANHDGGIHPEPSPFEQGYQPETLPKITVPDLPDDAQGLSAEALAQVPTLTELVEDSAEGTPAELTDETDETVDDFDVVSAPEVTEPDVEIQDTPSQADTWGQELQVRMGKLNNDIHTLNARLDRLEERNKTKV